MNLKPLVAQSLPIYHSGYTCRAGIFVSLATGEQELAQPYLDPAMMSDLATAFGGF